MDKMLKDFEEELLKQSFSKYYINSGGCAKAAYAFYKHFAPVKEIKVKGALIFNWCSFYKNKTSPKRLVSNARDLINYCNHVVLVFEYKNEQYVIDAVNGISLKKDYIKNESERNSNVITGYVKPRLLKRIANSREGWNETFNVYHLKHLRKFLKENPLNV